jgi:hypothetical protein
MGMPRSDMSGYDYKMKADGRKVPGSCELVGPELAGLDGGP